MWNIGWAPKNVSKWQIGFNLAFNPLNAELNPICHLLALLGAHHILHVSRIRVKVLTCTKRLDSAVSESAADLGAPGAPKITFHNRITKYTKTAFFSVPYNSVLHKITQQSHSTGKVVSFPSIFGSCRFESQLDYWMSVLLHVFLQSVWANAKNLPSIYHKSPLPILS